MSGKKPNLACGHDGRHWKEYPSGWHCAKCWEEPEQMTCPLCNKPVERDLSGTNPEVAYMDGWHHTACLDRYNAEPEQPYTDEQADELAASMRDATNTRCLPDCQGDCPVCLPPEEYDKLHGTTTYPVDDPVFTAGAPTADEIAPLVDRVYAGNGGGCCLHIALEDGNLNDDDLRWCLNRAAEAGHPSCYAVALLYLMVPEAERDEMRGEAWGASFDLDANDAALAEVARLEERARIVQIIEGRKKPHPCTWNEWMDDLLAEIRGGRHWSYDALKLVHDDQIAALRAECDRHVEACVDAEHRADALRAERDELREELAAVRGANILLQDADAEVERMRPVVEAAEAFAYAHRYDFVFLIPALREAVDAYREATDG